MNTNLSKAFEEEFLSFIALYLANLVFAAIAIAIGLTIIVQQLASQPGLSSAGSSPGLIGVSFIQGCVAFVLGLIWISATAKLMKSVRIVRTAYREKKKRDMTTEDFTGMLVHIMTQYREQKTMIRAMVVICIIGSLCYMSLGLINIGQIASMITSDSETMPVLLTIVAAAINLTIGGASYLISTYFRRYAKVWDARLDALTRSEGELDRMLERA